MVEDGYDGIMYLDIFAKPAVDAGNAWSMTRLCQFHRPIKLGVRALKRSFREITTREGHLRVVLRVQFIYRYSVVLIRGNMYTR